MTERHNLFYVKQIIIFVLFSMKKFAVFTLLSIFIFNTVGYYIVFKVNQFEVRKEIKSRIKLSLPLEELTAIHIEKNKIENILWVKKNKEFYYNKILYDIVKTDETNTSTTFYCISDEKEQALFTNLDEHINLYISSTDNKNNSTSKKLKEHVVKIYFIHSFVFCFNESAILHKFAALKMNFTSESPEINSPPPKFV